MKISYKWLQTYFDSPLPPPKKIAEILTFHAFEIESVEPHGDDTILDVKVLPNRAHDCLSHLGIAKEIALIEKLAIKKPDTLNVSTHNVRDLKIDVDDPKLCPRYIGRVIENVKVGPSPEWLRIALESIGQRSINNIVDAANYVMFSVGQPLHAFDADKLRSSKLLVRRGKMGEKLHTLDAKDVEIDDSMILIADESDPLVIAGIKGGTKAEIDDSTKNIVLEAAKFDPVMIRRTSQKIGIRTDASHRFENEISADLPEYGMALFTKLVLELAGGTAGPIVDINHVTPKPAPKFVSAAQVNKLLGTDYSEDAVADVQNRIDYSFRMDLGRDADMIEEVGRVMGYEHVAATASTEQFPAPKPYAPYYFADFLRQHLAARGYSEIANYIFAEKGDLELANSLQKNKSFLRTDLATNFSEKFAQNVFNADLLGLAEVNLFEIGAVFPESGEIQHCIIASSGKRNLSDDLPWKVTNLYRGDKNFIEFSLDKIVAHGQAQSYDTIASTPISNVVYKNFSPYPFSPRDIAIFVPPETTESEVVALIKDTAGDLLVREPRLFDKFEKKFSDGTIKVSYAYRLVFQSHDRTLTTEEVNGIMNTIYISANSHPGWQVR